MQINTKYNLGDIIYPIWENEINEKFPCEACAGTGKVILLDNKEYKCPKCNGHNKYKIVRKIWEVRDEPIIIEEIDTSTEKEAKECYIIYKSKLTDFYLEDNCFLSRELALKECNKRNGEENVEPKIA